MSTTISATLPAATRHAIATAIASLNGSKYISVSWIKDDGTPRTAVINPRDFNGVKGDAASPSAQAAVATRRRSNPDLWNVRDHSSTARAKNGGNPRWISVRCRGTVEFRQGGNVITLNLS